MQSKGRIFPWISCLCLCSYSPGCWWPLCCQYVCTPVLVFSPAGPPRPFLQSCSPDRQCPVCTQVSSFLSPSCLLIVISPSFIKLFCFLLFACAVYLCPARCLQASFPFTSLTQYTLLFPSASAWASWTHLEVSQCKRHRPMNTKESLTQKSWWLQGNSCSASQRHALCRWNRWEIEMINLFLLSMYKAMSSKPWKGPDLNRFLGI